MALKKIQVYQIADKSREEYQCEYDELVKINESLYTKVYEGLLETQTKNIKDFLDETWRKLNILNKPVLYIGRNFGVSDVIIIEGMAYYCDCVGFVALDMFDVEQTIPLSNDYMNIVYVERGKPAYTSFVGRDLESMQRAVGGYIEPIILEDNVAIIGYEEAKIVGLPGNRHIPGTTSIIAGSFFICGDDGENFTDLPEDKIEKYLEVFAEPENITNEEVEDDIYIALEPMKSSKSLEDILDDLGMLINLNLPYDEDNDEELNYEELNL